MGAATWDMTHPAQAATAARAMGQIFALPLSVAAFTQGMLSQNIFLRAAMPDMARTMGRAAKFAQISSSSWRQPKYDVPGAQIETASVSPFFDLVHFKTLGGLGRPKVLLFAPMSGHDATVLNDTIRGLSAAHDVYVCAPVCASQVPADKGPLTLDAYIDTMQDLIRRFKGDVHTVAVSQPGPLLLASISLMEAAGDPCVPKSASFIGCPIDPRINPTKVERLTAQHGTDWFRRQALAPVPAGEPGAGRMVYPGMMQMSAFACMPANANEDIYDAAGIADLDGTYFLQTIDRIFMKAEIPSRAFVHTDANGHKTIADPAAITRVALMSVEGAQDEIVGRGQTHAALDLASSLSADMKTSHRQDGAGHYGIVHGPQWQQGVLPVLSRFIATTENRHKKPGANQRLVVS